MASGTPRLKDRENIGLSLESRFDLGYNAAHAFALAALRWHGYRPDNRYIVFQSLPHTVGTTNKDWLVLDNAHNRRNRSEYDDNFDVDVALVEAVLRVTREVETAVRAPGAVEKKPKA